jgi:hypothetical protein
MKWRLTEFRNLICLLLVLLSRSISLATSCAILSQKESEEIAQRSIGESFDHGLLFGLCIGIFAATLYVLLRNRRYIVASFYGLIAAVILVLYSFAETMSRGCLSSGIAISYYYKLIVGLVFVLAISIVFRNWRYRRTELTVISEAD